MTAEDDYKAFHAVPIDWDDELLVAQIKLENIVNPPTESDRAWLTDVAMATSTTEEVDRG